MKKAASLLQLHSKQISDVILTKLSLPLTHLLEIQPRPLQLLRQYLAKSLLLCPLKIMLKYASSSGASSTCRAKAAAAGVVE